MKSNESSSSVKLRMDSILSSDSERVSKKFGQGIFEDTDDIDVYDNTSSRFNCLLSNNFYSNITL